MRFLVLLPMAGLFLLGEAFAFMILIGVIHAEWLPMLPTISYWATVKVGLATTLLTCVCAAAYGFAKEAIDE